MTREKPVVLRANKAFSKKDEVWSDLHQDVLELMFPARRTNKYDGGIKQDVFADIYDSTPMQSISSLANSLVATLTPAWTDWGAYVPAPAMPEEVQSQLKEQLEPVNKILFQAIRRSNLIRAVRPAFIDVLFGVGVMTVEHDGNGGVCYRNVPIESFAFEVSHNGDPNYTYHRDEMRADEMWDRYKDKSTELNTTNFQKLLKDNPETMVPFVVAVEPMNGADIASKFNMTVYVTREGMKGGILDTQELKYNPYVVARWELVPGTPWGIGPGITSYGDARYLNKIQETGLKAGILAINPPHLSSDGEIINNRTVKFAPGSIIPVDSTDRNAPSLTPYPMGGDVRMLEFEVSRRRDDIKKAFFADRFGPPTGTPMTAEEVIQRNNLINQELGSTVGLLEVDFLMPVVRNTTHILAAHAKDKNTRDVMKAVIDESDELEVVFLSQLARAQRAQQVSSIMEFVTVAVELGNVDPRAGDVVNVEKAVRQIATDLQIPDTVIRTETEAQAVGEQRQEQQQNAAMMQLAAQAQGGGGGPTGQGGAVQ
jgi:hypothetical protein